MLLLAMPDAVPTEYSVAKAQLCTEEASPTGGDQIGLTNKSLYHHIS